jgi:hypothetical protein
MERLNPVVTNFDKELLDPLVSIVTKYTLQAGICPLTPDDLMMMGTVNIEYVSQIHLAAKQSQIGAIDAWVAKVGQVAAAKPAILDNIDEDGLSGKYAELLGVPEVCVTSEDKVALVRQARQQTEAQAAQAAQMEALGNAAKIGSVPTDDQHLGGLITKGMGGE